MPVAKRPSRAFAMLQLGMLVLSAAIAWALFVAQIRVVRETRFVPASWRGAISETYTLHLLGGFDARAGRGARHGLPEALLLPPQPPPRIPPGIPARAVALVEQLEALKLHAYRDIAGVWTIGYGHTGRVAAHETISPREADVFLAGDLSTAADAVRRGVRVPLNVNEFSALLSLVFNIGEDAFAHSRGLTLLNEGERHAAAVAFLAFNKAKVRGRIAMLSGLVKRRRIEKALFLSPPLPEPKALMRMAEAKPQTELPLALLLGGRGPTPLPKPPPRPQDAVNRNWVVA